MTRAQAEKVLIDFIANQRQAQMTCVLIIHGKGTILKNLSYSLLQQHPAVLAASTAKPFHGGEGAVYVLLKSN